MDLSHIGGLVWVAIIAIGYVVSMRSSANKAKLAARPRVATPGRPPAQSQATAAPALARQTQRRFNVVLADDVGMTPSVATPMTASQAYEMPASDVMLRPAPVSHHTGWLSNQRALVRGIIASEILGPPLSLREPGSTSRF